MYMHQRPEPQFPAPDVALNVLMTIVCALVVISLGSQGALALVA